MKVKLGQELSLMFYMPHTLTAVINNYNEVALQNKGWA
jgi:hypothetical protein